MTPAGFEPTIPASEKPQTLDRAANGIGEIMACNLKKNTILFVFLFHLLNSEY